MSRNFELLQQIEKEHEVFPVAVRPAISGNGRKPGLDLDAISREEKMKLVQRLFLLPGSEAPHLVVFCGVETGDGSSWVCAQASETLASQVKASVCLVDANLRTPVFAQILRNGQLSGIGRRSSPVRACPQLCSSGLMEATCG